MTSASTEPPEERIIQAAAGCFGRWGIAKTSMGDIAEAAGMQRPRLYRHFETKDALITATIVRQARKLSEERLRRFPRQGPPSTLFVKALMHGQQRLTNDDFPTYVGHEGTGLLVHLLASDSAFVQAELIWWDPALDYGRARGEVREELTNPEIIEWFLLSQFTVYDRRDVLASDARIQAYLKRFVVPAILRCPSARQRHEAQ